MSSDWKVCQLGDVLTLQRGFDILKKQLKPGRYDVIFSSGVGGNHNEFKVKAPGVVIGRKGTLGTVFFAEKDFWPTDTTLWVKDFHGNDEKFAYYFLQTMHLEQLDCGAANPTLNRNHIHTLPIRYPPLPIQRKIAAILSAYDDLIENNTRRIEILEEMARSLYREWFVNFRFPGHEQVKMVDSNTELGLVPEGWEAKPVGELLKSYMGGGWGKEKPTEEETALVAVIRGADLKDLYIGNAADFPLRYIKPNSLKKRCLEAGDLIVENSVNASSRTVGTSLLVTKGLLKRIGYDSISASFCKLFKPKNPQMGALLNLHLKYLREEKKMEFYQNVATNGIANFQAQRFVETEFILLPQDNKLLQYMLDILNDLRSSVLADKNANLHQTRDLLLPKLISGELDVETLDINTGEIAA
jgi:type I restriction enzyme S subunit